MTSATVRPRHAARWLSAAFSVFMLAVAAGAQEPATRAAPPHTIRIAGWNLLNLFDNEDDPQKEDEGTDPKSYFEMQALARAIDGLAADVLSVEEVENRAVLETLNRHLARPFLYVELVEGNDPRGIDVGLLSRFPIDRVQSHRLRPLDGGLRFARDFPVFRVRPSPKTAVEIGVVHLKSKLGKKEDSDAWRLAEAQAARAILEELRQRDPATPVVVLGDFNDTRDSTPLAPFFGYLKDALASVPLSERYTYVHDKKPEQIDHLLASADLAAVRAGVTHYEDQPSDHAPIWADFALAQAPVRLEAPAGIAWTEPARPKVGATDLDALRRHLLQEVVVSGTVLKVHRTGGGASLNFADPYEKALVVYVPKDAEKRFGDLDLLIGKTVSVAGPVSRRGKTLQIRMTRREQLSE
jgi:endonuclease/exonuclease/phosphatase family metal-dependent hydrolase